MTFNETLETWFPDGFENFEGNLNDYDLLGVWNAAIEAAQDELLQHDYYREGGGFYHPENDLEVLKSS